METLKNLQTLVDELNTTNSSTDKLATLKRHPECQKILLYTYNPFTQFHVTSKSLLKNPSLLEVNSMDIFQLLDSLSNREYTGHEAIGLINHFLQENVKYTELIYNIIDKDLKTRAGIKLINKAFPKLIKTFEVALAASYKDREDKVNFEKDDWYASRKLDGVRCVMIEDYTAYSRQGKEFTTIQKIKDAILKSHLQGFVFDGEVCMVDKHGNEDFQTVMKEIKKKDHQILHPKYYIFDHLLMPEFIGEVTSNKFSFRLKVLKGLKTELESTGYIKIVEQTKVMSKAHLEELKKEAKEKGWEGLILRKDVPYEGKRSNNLLKVKEFQEAEYKVLRTESGPFRIVEKGKEKTITTMTNVIIEHKGYEVSVGSGWSLAQRVRYHLNPKELINQEITVNFFEETTNKEGGISLRFPTLKAVHGEKRTV